MTLVATRERVVRVAPCVLCVQRIDTACIESRFLEYGAGIVLLAEFEWRMVEQLSQSSEDENKYKKNAIFCYALRAGKSRCMYYRRYAQRKTAVGCIQSRPSSVKLYLAMA